MIEIIKYDSNPISLMGKVAGICWGANILDQERNYKRGIECIENEHGRVEEFADVTMVIDDYSARVIRELYTHIIGTSKLQESTRYIDCSKFDFYTPNSIKNNADADAVYNNIMDNIKETYTALIGLGIKKEDVANILPLGMSTKIVLRINVRALIHMFELRSCTRAYIEYRQLMNEMKKQLSSLDQEWDTLCKNYFKTKCIKLGYCNERYSCGMMPKKGK